MNKQELRRELRVLPPLPVDVAAERSARLCARLANLPVWENARVVALYSATAHEPDLSLLWNERAGRLFCFPRVEGDGIAEEHLVFYRTESPDALLNSRWGLREPAPDPARRIADEDIDLVLVPGVAFTAAGDRLGRGRGHYDRFLPRLRPAAQTVGVCFRERLLPSLPTEAHDRRLDHVVAE